MKVAYIITMYLLSFVILNRILRLQKEEGKEVKSMISLFIIELTTVVANCVYVISPNYGVALLAQCLFYAQIDWLLILMLHYTRIYTDSGELSLKWIPYAICAVAALDSIDMVLNYFFGHVFSLESMLIFGDRLWVPVSYSFCFTIHLLVSYALVGLILLALIHKIVHVSGTYRMKYIGVLGIFCVILVADGISLIAGWPIDLMMLCFCSASVAIYHYTLEYVPKGLADGIMAKVLGDAKEALVCFNNQGKCFYANNAARQILGLADDLSVVDSMYENRVDSINPLEYGEVHSWEETHVVNGRTRRYEADAQTIFDDDFIKTGFVIILRDMTEVLTGIEDDHYKANYDMLTGCFREEKFYDSVRSELDRNEDTKYCVLVSRIKDYHMIEDFFGQKKADEVLCAQAENMKKLVNPGTVYGKLKDDMFGLVIPKKRFLDKIFVDTIKQMSVSFAEKVYRLHIYVGVYEPQDNSESIESMIGKATRAINKIYGDNDAYVAYYDEELAQKEYREEQIVKELDASLAKGEFALYLQGQVDSEGKLVGAKGNTRWQHPTLGLIHPNEFRPILEKRGLIYKLDNYIWKQAAGQLKAWKHQGIENLYISVVAAPNNHYYTDIYKNLIDLIDKYELSPKNLHIEVTEEIFVNDQNNIISILNRLREKGFHVQCGNFGKNYSALKSLRDNNLDSVKMSLSYLADKNQLERGLSMIKDVIRLCKNLNIATAVEGVDSVELESQLREAGCDYYAGDLYCEPMSVSRFEYKYKLR